MSRSALPGVTWFQTALVVHVVLVRSNRNGESAASGAVAPEKESLRTLTWASIMPVIRVLPASSRGALEMTWKIVGMVTEPGAIVGRSLMTP